MVTRELDLSVDSAKPVGARFAHLRHGAVVTPRVMLAGAAVAAFALAPIEGYSIALHPQLGKLTGALLAGAWLLLRWRIRPLPRIHPIYVLLAALAAVVSTSTTMHLADTFAMEYIVRWIPFIVIAAIITDVASAVVGIRPLLAAALVGATAAASGALYSFLVLHEPRATGPLNDPNDLAYVLIAALPLIVAFSPRGLPARACLLASATVITAAAAVTFSRGALMAATAALVWVCLRRALPAKAIAGIAVGVATLGYLATTYAAPLVSKALSEKTFIAEANVDTRLMRWQAAARMLADAPLFGVGPGGFREHYAAFSNLAEIGEPTPVAHNMYLEVGAELGVLGLIAFIAIIVTAFVCSENALRRGADRHVVVAVQASLIAIVVASAFLSEQYYFPLWSMVAVACAVGLRSERGKQC
jgi:putative inorganic carbon (hco3(-)) transporter